MMRVKLGASLQQNLTNDRLQSVTYSRDMPVQQRL